MEYKPLTINMPVLPRKRSKVLGIVLVGVLALALVFWWSNSYTYNKALKQANKANKIKIDSIQATKAPLLDSLDRVALKIEQKNAYILKLTQKESELSFKLKYSKNENKRLKDSYRSSNISQRVQLWSELTTEKDTTRTAAN